MYLEIESVRKSFDDFVALNNVDLSVDEHEFVCLLGPSGCGKTTLLRIIAGLLPADSGRFILGGRDLSDVPARNRGFGIVFQSYSLFPNMTVAANIGYGLRIRRESAVQISKRTDELLALVKLSELADRYPWQLSGGQQQRVALARALAVNPALLLLDEPLSALDARVRMEMRGEIHEVQRRLDIPTIMVTHDQEEALALADKIVCMNEGGIEQVGTPQELYLQPNTRFVADFVGLSNLLSTEWVRTLMPQLLADRPAGDDVSYDACIRPERISIVPEVEAEGRVLDVTFLGNLSKLSVEWHGYQLIVEGRGDVAVAQGDAVRVEVDHGGCTWVRT